MEAVLRTKTIRRGGGAAPSTGVRRDPARVRAPRAPVAQEEVRVGCHSDRGDEAGLRRALAEAGFPPA